jgi:hypothetical protein
MIEGEGWKKVLYAGQRTTNRNAALLPRSKYIAYTQMALLMSLAPIRSFAASLLPLLFVVFNSAKLFKFQSFC